METRSRFERIDKFAARRSELAFAAMDTLSRLGYANTTLRDIADASKYSHGVIHYYFQDKIDLVCCAVLEYKTRCIDHYYDELEGVAGAEQLIQEYANLLAYSAKNGAALHRLWYDMRTQSLFDPAFESVVGEINGSLKNMVHGVVQRYAELAGADGLLLPAHATYAVFDGLFEQAIHRLHADDSVAIDDLRQHVIAVLPLLVSTTS